MLTMLINCGQSADQEKGVDDMNYCVCGCDVDSDSDIASPTRALPWPSGPQGPKSPRASKRPAAGHEAASPEATSHVR